MNVQLVGLFSTIRVFALIVTERPTRIFEGSENFPVQTMAKLEIKATSIECETTGFRSPDYKAYVGFETPETLEKDTRKQLTVTLEASNRQECTFDHVEEEINNYLNEHFPDLEIEKITSIQVKEEETIKSGFDLE